MDSDSAKGFLVKRDLAERLLSKLETQNRLLVTLFYGEEHSIAKIAELVGWSPNNVKVRLFRTRNFLRDVFKNF